MFRNFSKLSISLTRTVPRFAPAKTSFFLTPTAQVFRKYSSGASLTPDLIKERLLEILEGYDKVPANYKITEATDFSKDLGLDSLDLVEVVMAIEEEFSIGIPDDKADKIRTFKDALELIEHDQFAV